MPLTLAHEIMDRHMLDGVFWGVCCYIPTLLIGVVGLGLTRLANPIFARITSVITLLNASLVLSQIVMCNATPGAKVLLYMLFPLPAVGCAMATFYILYKRKHPDS